MSKEPYLPLFVGDFVASTADMPGEAAALYLLMLSHQWALGSLPAPIEANASGEKTNERLLRLLRFEKNNFEKFWPFLKKKFVIDGDRMINPRLEEHRVKSLQIREKRALAGAAGGVQSGLTRQKKMNEANASVLLKHPSSYDLNLKNKEKEGEANASVLLRRKTYRNVDRFVRPEESVVLQPPQGINVDAWNEWTNYRKSIGKALKPPNYSRTWEKMLSFGDSTAQQAAVAHSIADGYIGLFAPKPNYQPKANGKPVVSDAERDRTMATLAERATLIGFRQPTPADDVVAYEALVRRAEDSHWTAKRIAELTTKGKA